MAVLSSRRASVVIRLAHAGRQDAHPQRAPCAGAEILAPLLGAATLPPELGTRVDARARALVRAARAAHRPGADVTDFLAEYGLGTAEGVALLCLAEALLRIPDAATADALIEDRIATADWQSHLGQGDSMAVNASAWAFMLTGRVLTLDEAPGGIQAAIGRMIRRLGEPVIRTALRRGMRVLARQFVMGRTIEEALARADRRLRYSFDMLGEAAKTHADAERYRLAYLDAIGAIGRQRGRAWTDRRAGHLGEAVGAASSLRAVAGRTLRAGADRDADRARVGGEGGEHRSHGRCGGG